MAQPRISMLYVQIGYMKLEEVRMWIFNPGFVQRRSESTGNINGKNYFPKGEKAVTRGRTPLPHLKKNLVDMEHNDKSDKLMYSYLYKQLIVLY